MRCLTQPTARGQIALSATASSTIPVTYSVAGPASVFGSILTINGAGTVTVTANQSGNATYAAATPVSQTFAVAPAVLTVAANNLSRAYNTANPTLTYTITGFVNGDAQLTATTGSPSLSRPPPPQLLRLVRIPSQFGEFACSAELYLPCGQRDNDGDQ